MSALNPSRTGSEDATDLRPSTLRRYVPDPRTTVRTFAFWLAVSLPFLYVPLLVDGVSNAGGRGALAVLLTLNLVSLYVGHDHRPD